jgi:hypothetical protein
VCRCGVLVVLVALLGGLAGCGQVASVEATPATVPAGGGVAAMTTPTRPAPTETSAATTPQLGAADACWQASSPTLPPEKRAMDEEICRLQATALAQTWTPVAVATWPTATPTATIAPATLTAVASLPECRASDLAVREVGSNGAGGAIVLVFRFWNRGTTSCTLAGAPGAALLDGDGGAVLAVSPVADLAGLRLFNGMPARPVVLIPGLPEPTEHGNLPPGYATAAIWYPSRGPYAGGEPCRPPVPIPVRLRFTLPQSGETLDSERSPVPCDRWIRADPFQ